jgi:hypothetical protein
MSLKESPAQKIILKAIKLIMSAVPKSGWIKISIKGIKMIKIPPI